MSQRRSHRSIRVLALLLVGTMAGSSTSRGWSSSSSSGVLAVLGQDVLVVGSDGTLWSYGPAGSTRLLSDVLSVVAEDDRAIVTRRDGTIVALGSDGRPSSQSVPPGIQEIACGARHCLSWSIDGRTSAWGANESGQLGDGTLEDRPRPVLIALPGPVRRLAAGRKHSLAIDDAGVLFAWGSNTFGQLGTTEGDELRPVRVEGLPPLSHVAAGGRHTVALGVDGTAWTWGANDRGQLGLVGTVGGPQATRVTGLTGVVAVAAGETHSLALTRGGDVFAWGGNASREIGDDLGPIVWSPVKIAVRATAIAAGNGVTAILADGLLVRKGSRALPVASGAGYTGGIASAHPVTPAASGSPKTALFVAGAVPLSTADAALNTRLVTLGYTVTQKTGAAAVTADATGQTVVVISSTVNPTDVNTKFRNVTVPVVTWETGIFANMNMTGTTSGTNFGTQATQTQVVIATASHPLAGGLTGTVTVSTSSTYAWGSVSATGVKVATIVGQTGRAAIFGYETGATMVGLAAPARRVGLFLQDTTALATAGGTLFDAAIKWASNRPATVNAGIDQSIVWPATAALSGTASDDGLPVPPGALTTTWSKVSGPGTVGFGNANALSTTATFSSAGSYVLRLTATDGEVAVPDDVAITAAVNVAPTVSAGPDLEVFLPSSATLDGTVTDDGLPTPPAVTVTWSKVSGPGTVTFGNANAVDTTATFSVNGTYVLRLTASDGALSTPDDTTVTVNNPATCVFVVGNTVLGAGDAAIKTRLQNLGLVPLVLSGTQAAAPDATGKLVVVISSTVTPTDVNTKFRDVLVPVVTWETGIFGNMNMTGTTSGTNFGTQATQTQVVIATASHPLAGGLTGTVTVSTSSTYAWGSVSGTGVKVATIVGQTGRAAIFGYETGVTMVGLAAPARRVGLFLQDTTSLNASGGTLFDAAINWAVNRPPLVNAGVDQSITLPAAAMLAGTATDDGRPTPPGALTTTWSKVSGPGTVVFGNASLVSTSATFSAAGAYVLRLTATDGQTPVTDDIGITVSSTPVNAAPTVSAGPDLELFLPSTATLDGTVTDDGVPAPPSLSVTWSKVSGPGTVAFGNANAIDTTATFSVNGTYVLRLTASDGALSTQDDATVVVNNPATCVFVVGNTVLGTGDAAIKTRLQNLGLVPLVLSGTQAAASDATGKLVVVISSTVNPTDVNTKFRNVAVPVVTWESSLFDDMNMTGTTASDFGTQTTQTQVAIAASTHPMAAGLSGTQTVSTSSTFGWGLPGANGTKVATVVGNANRATIFGYEAAAPMVGLSAPARRVGLFLQDTTALTANGGTLFDAAINWALAPPQLPVPTINPSSNTYATAQTVTITCPSCAAGSDLRYTTNGSDPTLGSTLYTGSFSVATATQVRARAFKTNWVTSAAAVADYVFNYGTLSPPVIAPVGGLSRDPVTVTMTAQAGATIRYTVDGSSPTPASPAYSAPFVLIQPTTVTARAYQVDYSPSTTSVQAFNVLIVRAQLDYPRGPVRVAAWGFGWAFQCGSAVSGHTVLVDDVAVPGATFDVGVDRPDVVAAFAALCPNVPVPSGFYFNFPLGSLTLGAHQLKIRVLDSSGLPVDSNHLDIEVVPDVAAGHEHAFGSSSTGALWGWGRNDYGQVGDGTTSATRLPVPLVVINSGAWQTVAGKSHSMSLGYDGSVWAWGDNALGQLGVTGIPSASAPVQVSSLTDIWQVAAGGRHSLALSDGTVWAWGANDYGQAAGTQPSATPTPVAGLGYVNAIAAGEDHSLALLDDGTVWGWGRNDKGQLGTAPAAFYATPVQVAGLTGVTEIFSGSAASHSFARTGSGIVAWGLNADGQLGGGSVSALERTPVPTLISASVSRLAAGAHHSVARVAGNVWTWGGNTAGQLGFSGAGRATPASLAFPVGILAVAAGVDYTVIGRSDGEFLTWGLNGSGQLGDLPGASRATPDVVYGPTLSEARVATPTLTPPAGQYPGGQLISIFSSTPGAELHFTTDGSAPSISSPIYSAPFAIVAPTTVRVLGTRSGWLASSPVTASYTIQPKLPTPIITPPGGPYAGPQSVSISCSSCPSGSVIRYTANGTQPSSTNGSDYVGPIFVSSSTIIQAKALKGGWTDSDTATTAYYITTLAFGAIAAGGNHSLAALPDGHAWSWGSNNSGELGIGAATEAGVYQPGAIPGLTSIIRVAAGEAFSLALRFDGGVYAFGLNDAGQLGLGDTTSRAVPSLTGLTGVTAVAAGTKHGLALKADGTVWAWGDNQYGQIGDGSSAPTRTSAVQVTGLAGVTAIAAGAYHSLALTSDGAVWAWGLNNYYQLGDGTTIQRNQPVRVDGLFSIVAIGSGSGALTSMAVRSDGAAFAWGMNDFGQLGDGTIVARTTPVRVLGLSQAVSVGTNRYVSTAVRADGTLWAWGLAGAVGDGSGSTATEDPNRLVPVQLAPAGIVAVSSAHGQSAGHSLALSSDGVIWSWMYNSLGQIGDGSGILTRYWPVRVTEPGFALKVATPWLSHSAAFTYYAPIDVTATSGTSGAVIRYTTDGNDPTGASPAYAGAVHIAQTTTFKAKAFKTGLADSNVETAVYSLAATTPTFSPVGGTYTTPQTVTISASPGTDIRYTTDNSDPTAASALYTSPLAVNANTTLKAKAFSSSLVTSQVGIAAYTFDFPASGAPSFMPVAGTYVGSVAVTITGPAGSTVHYTTDGSDPTATSTLYSAPLGLVMTTTLKAKAYKTAMSPSASTSGDYVVELVAPTLSPAGGSISPGQAITLNHGDPSAVIRYTINGVDPGPTDAIAAPGSSVTLYKSLTLKARAYKPGVNPSVVTSGTFSVSGTAGAAGVIAAGGYHALLAKPDGTAWAWGQSFSGQLGDGTFVNKSSPTLISNLSGITGLAAGAAYSVARKSDGTPWTTGDNGFGQLGDGTTTSRTAFAALAKPGGVDVIAVATGDSHTLALGADGRVWAWGRNASGQLGNGNNTQQTLPVLVSGLSTVTAIAAAGSHSLALTASGQVWAWGLNTDGQLGNGSTTSSNVPVLVTITGGANIADVIGIAAGRSHSLAIRHVDGSGLEDTIWSWGDNAYGQLGSGALSIDRPRAARVDQLADVRGIAAGAWTTFAVRSDGSAWAWGYGGYWQIGNGLGADQPAPVQIPGITGIDSVAAGERFVLALGLDGSVWAWGDNSSGQLGDGTTETRGTPTRVADGGTTWRVGLPIFNPAGSSLSQPQDITLTCSTPGAAIHYTMNGADPTQADPSVASGGTVWVDVALTLKARAYKTGWSPSSVQSVTYSMTLAAPSVNPAAGTYNVPVDVALTHPVAGVVLHFTTDGSPVSASSPVVYGPLAIGESTSVRVMGFRAGLGPSGGTAQGPEARFDYQMQVGTPAHSASGFGGGLRIGVTTVTPGAIMRFAMGGQGLPSGSSALTPPDGVWTGRSTTIRTRGWHAGLWDTSGFQSTSHFIAKGPAAMPAFALGASTAAGRFLKMSSSTSAATLRYTVDGSEPTFYSTPYHGPLQVSPGMTVRARAFGADNTPSTSTTVFSTGASDPGAAEPPTFNPPGGTYATARAVILTSPTSNATIYYTTNGADPTTSDPSVASGGTVNVTRGLPLKARAYATGKTASTVARADYRITGAITAGHFDSFYSTQSGLALKTDGTVWGWGANSGGELGINNTLAQQSPVQVLSLPSAVSVALGMRHGLAVTAAGNVWSWGQNNYGQLGDSSTSAHLTPAMIPALNGVTAVTAAANASFALTGSGLVYSWGSDAYGLLGDGGTDADRSTPALVAGLTDVTAIDAGADHVLALKNDGTVWAWGVNGSGQLGDGTITNRNAPVQVTGLFGVTAISAGGAQSLAIKSDGEARGQVWAWGAGAFYGTIGDGMNVDQPTPVHILDDAKSVYTADSTVSYYLKASSSPVTALWGSGNHFASLVSGGGADRSELPVPVTSGNFVAVSGGALFLTALRWDTTLLQWAGFANVNGFALGDVAWANTDHDADGLTTAQEWDLGTDPWDADSNDDGILDGATVGVGADPLDTDVDSDGVANALERAQGTDPFRADTDGDGYADGADAYPLDPTRWDGPPPNAGDTTPPLVTLTEPSSATLVSVVPIP